MTSLNKREKEFAKIPILSVGKTANVLWAKSSDLVAEQIVLRASLTQIIFFKIQKILMFGEVRLFKELLDRAKREVILRIKESAKHADFIANLRFADCNLKRHQVEVIGYATAVYMEEGADLPYQFASYTPHINTKQPLNVLKKLGALAVIIFSLTITLYLSSVFVTKNYKEHLSYEDEVHLLEQIERAYPEILSNDQKEALKLMKVEQKLQKTLDAITNSNNLAPMTLHLFSSDDRADIVGLPTGKVLVSWELIASLHSYEEINFIIANQVAHNLKKNYLKALGNYLGASIIFSNNSMFSDSLIAIAPIFKHKADIADEVEADRMAIEMLDRLDGHVGGATEFIRTSQRIVQEDNHSFMPTHVISKERSIAIAKLIQERNLRIKQVRQHSLHDEVLDEDDIDNSEDEEVTIKKVHANFLKRVRNLRNHYRTTVFEKYEKEMRTLSNLSTIEGLERNEQLLKQAIAEISEYKQRVRELEREYDNLVLPIANQIPEAGGRQRIFKIWWQKEKLSMDSFFNFYFKRDTEIFKIRESEMRFLKKRFGRYRIEGKRLVLYDDVTREHYNKLRKKLVAKLKEKFHENEDKIIKQPDSENFWDNVKRIF